MSERPKSASVVVHLLIAVTVLGLGFGGGALFGWSTRKRTPTPPEKSAEAIPDAEVKSELAACRRELKAIKKARAMPKVMVTPGELDDAGVEVAAKVEALQKEVHECRVRETLQNGYVCGTIREHDNLHYVLVLGNACVEPPGIGEYLLNSVAKCAEFAELDEYPPHIDEDNLTQQEKMRIMFSKWSWKLKKDNMAWSLQWTRRECRRIWALPDE
ncbi:MAG: hypothetical protein IPM54_20155 [Polyangiaceae bacterium]|nr:hypothetical protein [Polyangiaceae bacterium]